MVRVEVVDVEGEGAEDEHAGRSERDCIHESPASEKPILVIKETPIPPVRLANQRLVVRKLRIFEQGVC